MHARQLPNLTMQEKLKIPQCKISSKSHKARPVPISQCKTSWQFHYAKRALSFSEQDQLHNTSMRNQTQSPNMKLDRHFDFELPIKILSRQIFSPIPHLIGNFTLKNF